MSLFEDFLYGYEENQNREPGTVEIIPESYFNEVSLESSIAIMEASFSLKAIEILEEKSILLEEAKKNVADSKNKILDAFRTLLSKVKAWFTRIFRVVGVLFTSSSEFIEKYKGQLQMNMKKYGEYRRSGKNYLYKSNLVDIISSNRNQLVKSCAKIIKDSYIQNVIIERRKQEEEKKEEASKDKEDTKIGSINSEKVKENFYILREADNDENETSTDDFGTKIINNISDKYEGIDDFIKDVESQCYTVREDGITYSIQDLKNMIMYMEHSNKDMDAIKELFHDTTKILEEAISKLPTLHEPETIRKGSSATNIAAGYINKFSPRAVKLITQRVRHARSTLDSYLIHHTKQNVKNEMDEENRQSNSTDLKQKNKDLKKQIKDNKKEMRKQFITNKLSRRKKK